MQEVDKDRDLLARCAAIAVSTWSDALDELGVKGVVQGIKHRSGQGRMSGFAVPAKHVAGTLGEFDKSKFGVGQLVAAATPGTVLMIDVNGAAISTLGGLAALSVKAQGASGVVIDGGCRDLDEIRATGLWLASRWVTPTTGKGRLNLQRLGQAVSIGGVSVGPSDLVVGDETGVVVVPRSRLKEALEIATRITDLDERVEKLIRAGKPFAIAAAMEGYLPAEEAK
ncbi:RraA family protein [Bradyrhizobium retamae]|uniref:Putative 4-hydroxy-4-methyl-2-oxoglutarate aldolase n=1 Tax=Bradyrhizobium retamae TaxID=1300035 RepID=A0A0R3MAC2_9BRAD|nr:RraA family protein [Bradyrhizobium retamae]KRR15055.1 demethylmenaquinone methyltransferase [Bradyrhizobium retamae]